VRGGPADRPRRTERCSRLFAMSCGGGLRPESRHVFLGGGGGKQLVHPRCIVRRRAKPLTLNGAGSVFRSSHCFGAGATEVNDGGEKDKEAGGCR
jgi:hypothetical protein